MPLNNRLVNQPFDVWEGSGARWTKMKDNFPVKPELCKQVALDGNDCDIERPCPVHDESAKPVQPKGQCPHGYPQTVRCSRCGE